MDHVDYLRIAGSNVMDWDGQRRKEMRSLYEIDQAIIECVDLETGEVLDLEALTALQMERTEKIENVALYVKNLNAEVQMLKAEKEAFAQRQKAAEAKLDGLKNWLKYALDGQKMTTPKVAITFRRSEKVEAPDVSLIPVEYLRVKTTYEADKDKIKEAIKRGEDVSGAELIETQNITIK